MEPDQIDPQVAKVLAAQYDNQLKLLTAAYSQAQAFFNVVIVAGYAAFFALWKLADPALGDLQELGAAFLLSFSLICFVTWQVAQMFITSRSLLGIATAVKDPVEFPRLIEEHNEQEAIRMRSLGRVWRVVLVLTILPAAGGAAILMWAFVAGLFNAYCAAFGGPCTS